MGLISPPSGNSVDSSTVDADARQKTGRRRKARGTSTSATGVNSSTTTGSSCSILSILLTVGVVFCLLDVLYMVAYIDRHQQHQLQQQHAAAAVESSTKSGAAVDHSRLKEQVDNLNPLDKSYGGDNSDKGPILQLIKEAGVNIAKMDQALLDELPTWKQVTDLYGTEPVIVGLDQCEVFQQHSDAAEHFVSTAGTFNTGTNLMAELLIANCHMQARMDKYGAVNRGVRWQVPWGKHTPPGDEEFRQNHKTKHDASVNANNILPAVTVRDPLVWMSSMCKHPYGAHWDHGTDHCPDFSLSQLKTHLKYAEFNRDHESLVHFWNDYYNEYQAVKFSHLIVRFEDLVFHTKEVTKQVCECAGGSMRKDGRFKYIVDTAKKGEGAHGKVRTGYVDAIIKYGSAERRYENYPHAPDLEYIRDHLDPKLMEIFQYPMPDPALNAAVNVAAA